MNFLQVVSTDSASSFIRDRKVVVFKSTRTSLCFHCTFHFSAIVLAKVPSHPHTSWHIDTLGHYHNFSTTKPHIEVVDPAHKITESDLISQAASESISEEPQSLVLF